MLSALYAVRYMDHYPDYGLGGFTAAFPLFVLGMAALVVVDDLSVGFTLAWQLMTIASFFLIRFERRKRENVRAAAKYLILMELAWLLVVAGGPPGRRLSATRSTPWPASSAAWAAGRSPPSTPSFCSASA